MIQHYIDKYWKRAMITVIAVVEYISLHHDEIVGIAETLAKAV